MWFQSQIYQASLPASSNLYPPPLPPPCGDQFCCQYIVPFLQIYKQLCIYLSIYLSIYLYPHLLLDGNGPHILFPTFLFSFSCVSWKLLLASFS